MTFVLVPFSLHQLERANDIASEIEVDWFPATRTLGDINKGLSDLRIIRIEESCIPRAKAHPPGKKG